MLISCTHGKITLDKKLPLDGATFSSLDVRPFCCIANSVRSRDKYMIRVRLHLQLNLYEFVQIGYENYLKKFIIVFDLGVDIFLQYLNQAVFKSA